MGSRYTAGRASSALSTANDTLTIKAPSDRAVKIWEIRLYGQGTSSAANEVGVYRSTVGTTPGGGVTPTPMSGLAPAATTLVYTTWSVQPTLGALLRRIGVNSNGAYSPQIYMPGNEIDVPPGGQLSIRSVAGTGNVTAEVLFEEIG